MPDSLFPEDLLDEDSAYTDDNEVEYLEDEAPEGAEAYLASIYFDFETGDFATGHDGKTMEATGQEAWEQWCHKVLRTRKEVCAAYPSEIGIDFDRLVQAESRGEVENILNREIKEALMSDTRTQFVGSISFEWHQDTLEATVPVTGVYGTSEITASYEEVT